MWQFTSILVSFLVLTSLAETQSVELSFQLNAVNLYQCVIRNQTILSDNDLIEITGAHVEGYTNSDVLILNSVYSIVEVFPDKIINLFPNLIFLYLAVTELKTFGNPLQNCGSLAEISLGVNEIESVPAGIFQNCHNLTDLQLAFNSISSIDSDAFIGLINLQSLDLRWNKITEIGANVFAQLGNLRNLDLRHNMIYILAPEAFHALHQLKYLGLESNKIQNWSVTFLANNTALTSLSLADNNIATITDAMFAANSNLVELSIGNLIAWMPTMMNLPKLQKLDLKSNKIKNVSIEMFVGFPELAVLNLAFNEITSIDFSTRSTSILPLLTSLDLKSNQISEVPDNVFSGLTGLLELGLQFNKIEKLSANSVRPTITRLDTLDLRSNKIAKIDRQVFDGVEVLLLQMSGNTCFSDDVQISRNFSLIAPLMEDCFNSAHLQIVNISTLIVAFTISFLWKL